MERRIFLTAEQPELGDIGPAIAVVAKGYSAPPGIPVHEVAELLAIPALMDRSPLTLVMCGISKLITPGNRVTLDPIWGRRRPGLRRISIDRLLFVSEPWRIWWHFSAVGDERWGYTDSFLAETRWRAAIERKLPDPFGIEETLRRCDGIVHVRDAFRFGSIPVRTIALPGHAHDEYALVKEAAFRDVGSIAGIIKRLSDFAQRICPERSVPTQSRLFSATPKEIVRTELAVDTYLTEHLLNRIKLTNAIADLRS